MFELLNTHILLEYVLRTIIFSYMAQYFTNFITGKILVLINYLINYNKLNHCLNALEST